MTIALIIFTSFNHDVFVRDQESKLLTSFPLRNLNINGKNIAGKLNIVLTASTTGKFLRIAFDERNFKLIRSMR